MKIHYNNGDAEKEKVISDIIAIQLIGTNKPVTAVLSNGRELTISLDNIEMILDDSVTDKEEKSCTYKETDMGNDTAWVCERCGETWILNAGTPLENNMHYCPNCGAKITKSIPFAEGKNDEENQD